MYKKFNELSEQDKKLLQEIGQKDFSNYNEQDIREEVIAPIVRLLGYNKNNDYEVEREEDYEANQLFLKLGSNKKLRLDYLCNIRKNNFWLIEAKSGKKKEITQEYLEQAYFYSLHPKVNCRYFAVTNGWLFNLYDRNKFLEDENSNIFVPILSIGHTEFESRFTELYHYLGASNIIFNVKNECLLKEIEKTLSAEVYLKRLEYFEISVGNVIEKAKRSVYRNIAKLTRDSDKKYEKYLNSLGLKEILDNAFTYRNINKNIQVACKVLKARLLEKTKYSDERHSSFDCFIEDLLPTKDFYRITIVNPVYLCNVLALLIDFHFDKDYQNLWCNYNNKKIYLSDLLEEYLYEIYSFFPQKPHVRLLLRLYALVYRYSKILVYCVEPIKALAILKQK